MSELFENNQDKNLEQPLADGNVSEEETTNAAIEESTVFSAPLEHKDKASKKSGKTSGKSFSTKRLITIIVACISVALLIVGTFYIEDYITETAEEEKPPQSEDVFPDIPLIDRDSSTFTSMDITNTKGTFKFTTKQITSTNDAGESQTKTYWCVNDVDVSKLSSSSISEIVTNVASITAKREIDTKTKEECGFNKPIIKVSVTDPKNGNINFSIGDKSPDGLGYYFSFDDSDKVYVVPTNELGTLHFELIDLTDKTAIPATIFDTDTSANKLADGSYGYFDSLTVSGALYGGETITIQNNKAENATAEIVPYIITTPKNMYAQKENIPSVLTLFSKSINVAGNYAIDINDQTLKQFKLDNPDAIVTMTINGESKSFKFSKIDEEFCAVIYDGATMIRKVTNESFAFLSLKTEDFYYKQPFMNSMSDISGIELVEGENRIKFDLSYTEDAEKVKTFHAKVNGTQMEIEDFQNFYEHFVDIRCSSFKVETPTTEAASTLTIYFHDGHTKTIQFYESSAIEYQFSIDDEHLGKITSASYQKMVRSFKEQAEAVKGE